MRAEQLKTIKELAGKIPSRQIAAKLGITRKSLENLCSLEKISISMKHVSDGTYRSTNETRCDAAVVLLLANGYTVLRPDPFRKYIDNRTQRNDN
tara:strand:+ start:319 stop:603 length:285 start_codon:yes stop_codon:yes gene_type:complete